MKYAKTTIDHNIRLALLLTSDQYIFLDCIHQFTIKKKFIVKWEEIAVLTGFDEVQIQVVFNSLKENDLLKVEGTKIRTTTKWEEQFVEVDVVEETIKYLNLKAQTDYKSKSKASVEHIQARNREGYTLDDFKLVIDAKVEDWLHNTEMREYLRPVTLFAPKKFEGYLEAAKMKFNKKTVPKDNMVI